MKVRNIIDQSFGDHYSAVYFEGEELKKDFQMLATGNAVLIYSSLFALVNQKIHQQSDKLKDCLVLNLIVVEQRNKKQGTALLNKFHIDNKHCNIVIPVWDYEGSVGLKKWISNQNGRLLKRVENYWRGESQQLQYLCKGCSVIPCVCAMELYLMEK